MQKSRSRVSELNKISKMTFYKHNVEKNNFSSSFATFGNIIEVCKIATLQWNHSILFLRVLNIYLFSKIVYFIKLKL